MQQVTKWQSNDGGLFDTEEDCRAHELRHYWLMKMQFDLRGDIENPEYVYKWILENTNGFNDVNPEVLEN